MRKFCVVLLALLVLSQVGIAKPQPVTLKKGDRIVFLGDSITAAGDRGNGFIALIKNSINAAHPDWGVETINAGVSGNKVTDLQARLQASVLEKKPAVVFIYIGINDVWHFTLRGRSGEIRGGTPKDQFEAGLKEIIGKIKDAGASVVLCTATVIGEKTDGKNEQDKLLDEYCDISRKVATETQVELVDLRKVFLEYLKSHNPSNQAKGILTADSVHLNPAGNKLVAEQMLKVFDVKLVEQPATPAKNKK